MRPRSRRCARQPCPAVGRADELRSGRASPRRRRRRPATRRSAWRIRRSGSLLTGRLSACDLDEPSSKVLVHSPRRGRRESSTRPAIPRAAGCNFVGTPCPDDPLGCFVGMNHRINVNDLQFSDALERSHADRRHRRRREHGRRLRRPAPARARFAPNSTNHSVRGTDVARGRRRDERLLPRQRRSAGDLGRRLEARRGVLAGGHPHQ